jgi:ATP-dependent Lon protease
MFILTANVLENIPDPLMDRMEVIEFPGYTHEEKRHIAERFLIPRQISEKGLADVPPVFTAAAVERMIREYTREAGIRNLDRLIAAVCRKIARNVVEDREHSRIETVTPEALERYLGRSRHRPAAVEDRDRVGVTTSLVWTEAGGDVITVEAAMMKGKNELTITGSLGDVMKESGQAALSYLRSNAASFGIPEDFFEHRDIHIHVPSGAVRKDGPSAGLAIAVALISLLLGKPARRDAAVSGEITLTGRVLPVGRIAEKVLAARRTGITTVVIPAKNSVDLADLDEELRRDVTIHLVDDVREAALIVIPRGMPEG